VTHLWSGQASSGADESAEAWEPAPAESDRRLQARARQRANQLRELYTHAGIYAIVIGFLFILDAITGSDWWFYWPALGWGIGLAIHALVVVGQEGLLGHQWEERKIQEWTRGKPASAPTVSPRPGPPATSADIREMIARGIDQVAGLRRTALNISQPAARAQVLRICATADNILAVLAEEGREPRIAHEFLDRYLTPATTIVTQYARLSSRGVASAHEALDHVETHDLPLIEEKMGELYERIHRGDVIDLQVASEMLEMGLMDRSPMKDRSTP
jgi:hypothetical protein